MAPSLGVSFHHLQKVKMILPTHFVKCHFIQVIVSGKKTLDLFKRHRPLSLLSAPSVAQTHFGVGIMNLNGGD